MSRRVATFAALLALAAAGCSGDDKGLVPVSGKVTFDGGPPPAGGFVSFVPERSPGQAARPARATFQQDGAYQATSFEEGDGVLPGRYTVTVECYKGAIDYSKPDPYGDSSYVAKDFPGKELVVEENAGALTLDIDVPLKKM